MAWALHPEPVCFNEIGEPVPCSHDVISDAEIDEMVRDYCGDLGQYCTEEELDETLESLSPKRRTTR